MFKKVLILSASSGAGHVRAAQALEKAFIEMEAAQEVRHVDTLQYASLIFRNLYSKSYLHTANRMPELLGFLYDRLDHPWKDEERRLAIDKLNLRPFIKMVRDYQPDIAVCTHFVPAEIISFLKEERDFAVPQAVVVTDFDAHSMWLCHHYEQYFVALDETKVHLQRCGITPDRITVSGIPIDPAFAHPLSKVEARSKLGLRQDLPTILLSAGGFGVGPIHRIVSELLQIKTSAQIVALCGRNVELKKRLEQATGKVAPKYHVSVNVVGHTDEMHDYMAAADLLVGKPGGLTTSEALASNLAMMVVNPIPGQEERNSDHLLEEGVALRCNNLPALAYKVDKLLTDPDRLQSMHENISRIAHPRAAYEIVEKLLRVQPLPLLAKTVRAR